MAIIENVSFLPAALQDIRDIHDWYVRQKPGLGKDFTNEVVKQVEALQKNIIIHRVLTILSKRFLS